MALEQKLEAVLFYKGEAESKSHLAKLLDTTVDEIEKAANALTASLESRGIRLLHIDDQLELVTAPETSEAINNMRKEELVRDLGKADSETLSIILYRGPVSRADIDYIRGVNSSFILRNLQIRGLVKRVQNPGDSRSFLYQATPELLKHLGVTDITALPNYNEIKTELDSFETDRHKEEEEAGDNEPLPMNTEI